MQTLQKVAVFSLAAIGAATIITTVALFAASASLYKIEDWGNDY